MVKRDSSLVKPSNTPKGSRQLTEEQIKNTLELAALADKQAAASEVRKNLMIGKKVGGYNTMRQKVKVVETKERIVVNPELYDVPTLRRREF